jgi:hypothetical protein
MVSGNMILRAVCVILGFLVACLAAATTLVLFVYTPAEFVSLPADMRSARYSEAGRFILAVVPHVAMFSAVFALFASAFAEVRGIASWTYHALVGVGIAVVGFLVQHLSEGPGQPSILQNYALLAFLTAGAVGGLAYWYVCGRYVRAPRPAISASQSAS